MSFKNPERGQGIVEYFLIATLLLVTVLAAAALLGPALATLVASRIPEFAALPRDTQITVGEVVTGVGVALTTLGLIIGFAQGNPPNNRS